MLTQRAQDFLATLRRDDAVPVAEVERMLAERGIPAYPAWLAFHERFAGYWESLSEGEYAIWGLALTRVSGNWAKPNTINVSVSKDGVPLTIDCADAHPSFDYRLRPDGTYVGPPFFSESFDIKVERNALMWSFVKAGPVERIFDIDGVSVRQLRDQLVEELEPYLVPEASDKFARYYASPDKLMLAAVDKPTLKLLVRAE